MNTETRNPCEELKILRLKYRQTQASGEATADQLNDLRYALHTRELKCQEYQQRVQLYKSEFELSDSDAAKQASSSGSRVDLTPIMPVVQPSRSGGIGKALFVEVLGQSLIPTVNYEISIPQRS